MKDSNRSQEPFWKTTPLARMSPEEWESLCDGCAKCCLFKLEDDELGDVVYTDVSCRLLNVHTCHCKSYAIRHALVPTCANLTPQRVETFHWLPASCAYRLLHEGKDLPFWHHLRSGDNDLIHKLGHSVKDRVTSEEYIHPDEITQHVVDWD